jgi:small GTP-binding protein
VGILTGDDFQIIFSDTPGYVSRPSYKMHNAMNRFVESTLEDADLMLLVIDATEDLQEDNPLVEVLLKNKAPLLIVLNKMDLVQPQRAEDVANWWKKRVQVATFIGISALKQEHTADLLERIIGYLPEGPAYYPLDQLNPDALRATAQNEPLYIVCRSGARGRKACEKLVDAGIANVVNIEGGTLACEQAGLKVIRGRKTISLMRQVQITVGSIGLVGSTLALTVDPLFAGIPAFLCAGLLFAGVTDTCMLAMMLAKMPWNNRSVACNAG